MPANYVRPYSKGQKNDFRDAEAIAEAVQRPTMKYVATKTVEQLAATRVMRSTADLVRSEPSFVTSCVTAVDRNARIREQTHQAAQFDKLHADLLDRWSTVLAEVGNSLVVRNEPAGQPHHLDIAPCLTLKPPARLNPIEITLRIELMLASDIVVAASDCRFAQIEVKREIMPSAGATIRMTERAGLGNALRYLLTGEEFNDETALRLGFVQEVVAPGSERQRAIEIATLISQQAPLAVAAILANARKAMFDGPNVAAAQLQKEQRRLQTSEDAAEGIRSFIEKRPAKFLGR